MSSKVTEVNFSQKFGGQPREFIYEDDQCVVFDEIMHPQAPVHFLVVPRKTLPRICDAQPHDEKLLGHMLLVAHEQARIRGIPSGYHVTMDESWRGVGKLNAIHVFGRSLHHDMARWTRG